MADCRNARVRLRRRLENRYSLKRVSVMSKEIRLKNEIGKDLDIKKVVPFILISIDLTSRKHDFIKKQYDDMRNDDREFLVRVSYSENECNNYKISFLLNKIDIGLNPIKPCGRDEIMNNIIPELEKVCREVELESKTQV